MTTSCHRCGVAVAEAEASRDFSGMCPGCLAGFAFEAPEELETLGKYRLLGLLGSGGMGVVHRAEHVDLGMPVALKLLRPYLTEAEQERFRHEARTLAKVRHPNIVPIHDFGIERGWSYLVMDLVTGKPLSREHPIEVLRKAALAVQHLHDQGIIHRDLKPANLLVDGAGEPHILDFGLAKTRDMSLTPSHAVLGTPSYMAPEQARGGEPDGRADVFALGAILYEWMGGRPPFTGETSAEVLRHVLEDDPVPPDGDPALARVCLKALEKDPARRYATAAEFAEDLRRWSAGEPVLARRRSLRLGKKLRRAAVPILAVLLAVAVAALFWRRSTPPSKPRPRIEDQIAALPDPEVRYLLSQGLGRYRAADWWGAAGLFGKCADLLERTELPEEQRAWARCTARVHVALAKWRLGHPDEAFREMRRAKWAGFRDDPVYEADDAYRAMKADPKFAELLKPATLEDLLSMTVNRNVKNLLQDGAQAYGEGDYWRAVGYFGKCASYLQNTSPAGIGMTVEEHARFLQQAHVRHALCQWRLGHRDDARKEMARAREAGFKDDALFADDDAFRELTK